MSFHQNWRLHRLVSVKSISISHVSTQTVPDHLHMTWPDSVLKVLCKMNRLRFPFIFFAFHQFWVATFFIFKMLCVSSLLLNCRLGDFYWRFILLSPSVFPPLFHNHAHTHDDSIELDQVSRESNGTWINIRRSTVATKAVSNTGTGWIWHWSAR